MCSAPQRTPHARATRRTAGGWRCRSATHTLARRSTSSSRRRGMEHGRRMCIPAWASAPAVEHRDPDLVASAAPLGNHDPESFVVGNNRSDTTTLTASGSTASSNPSSSVRTSSGDELDRPLQTTGGVSLPPDSTRGGLDDAVVEDSPPPTAHPASPEDGGPREAEPTARVPDKAWPWRPRRGGSARGRWRSSTSHSSCARLWRERPLAEHHENAAAPEGEDEEGGRAHQREPVAHHHLARFCDAGVGRGVQRGAAAARTRRRARVRCDTTRPASPPSRRGTRGREAGCGSRRSPRRRAPPRGRRSARSTTRWRRRATGRPDAAPRCRPPRPGTRARRATAPTRSRRRRGPGSRTARPD